MVTFSRRSSLTLIGRHIPPSYMNNDCVTVDELLLEIADYSNNGQEVAAEKLRRLCSQSYEAYDYLQYRVHDPWLPERARMHVRHILLNVRSQLHAFQEYGRTYPQE